MHLITLLIISEKKGKNYLNKMCQLSPLDLFLFYSLPGALFKRKHAEKNSEWTDFIPSILVSFCLFLLNIITEVGKINWSEDWI